MLVSISLYPLSICDKEKWQVEICSKSKPQSVMVLQGSWLIRHSVSLVVSCLDGVTSPLLEFHHGMGWNRWGSSGQPCPGFVEAPVRVCTAGPAWCPALCWGHWFCRDTSAGLVPLALPHWGCPGPRRAVPPPHCEKAKKPTSDYRMAAMNSSPQPSFFSVGWIFAPERMWFILRCCIPGEKPSEFTSCFHR